MSAQFLIVLLLAVVVGVYIGLAIRAFVRLRGKRLVVCPKTKQPAGVTVDALHAAVGAVW